MSPHFENSRVPVLRLVLIAFLAVLVHGYHLGVDDAEIYVPAIKRVADPSLYPFGSEFFMSHAHLSFFSNLVGLFTRLAHLPVNLVIFLFQIGGIFLLLLASWQLLCACFSSGSARWAGVATMASVLSVPVAGTALLIMDPYLTARSLSTPLTVFAVASFVTGKNRQALGWLLATAIIHPQMGAYCMVLLTGLALAREFELRSPEPRASKLASGFAFALLFGFEPATGAAREALLSRTYFFLFNWTWYEWLGIVAPLALIGWASARPVRGTTPVFRLVLRTLLPFGLLFTAAGLLLSYWPRLENFTRLQPMRSFHVVYVVFFLMLGGVVGEYLLKSNLWRWLGLFIPLVTAMWLVQRSTYPSSSHVEWPGATDRNPWNDAFVWARDHTPKTSVFALDPNYMLNAGEDSQGFRAIAERSALAENIKDSGAVSLFPQLADEWKKETNAQRGWTRFKNADFRRLAQSYPITWIVTRRPAPLGMTCLYQNAEVAVCPLDTPGDRGQPGTRK